MQPWLRTKNVHARSSAWLSGRKHSEWSSGLTVKNWLSESNSNVKPRWVSIAPRGSPVVPEV